MNIVPSIWFLIKFCNLNLNCSYSKKFQLMPHLVIISSLFFICPNESNTSPVNLIPHLNQVLFLVWHIIELYHIGTLHASVKLKGCSFTFKSSMEVM